MSNYKQNSINYFEGLLGETANIRRTGIGFGHFLILRGDTPYYTKNRGNLRGKEIRREILSEKDLDKYIRLFADNDAFPHKPEVLGIAIVNFNDQGRANFCLDELDLPSSIKETLENQLSLSTFLPRFDALCRLKQ